MKLETVQTALTARRSFLRWATSTAGLALASCAGAAATASSNAPASGGGAPEKKEEEGDEGEVTPGEDLMQEHGVIERLLLIYEEGIRRIEHQESYDPKVILDAAAIVRHFVE